MLPHVCERVFPSSRKNNEKLKGLWEGLYRTNGNAYRQPNLKWEHSSSNIRYGVVANIAVSHTAAGGSIPPIGVYHDIFFG
ncbi:hypothetical protein N7491_005654 [Penicillium cf. griseofulvum]|uniref:Uncharacterized protein n=1 Tax=Penicillium cf. griseofulvum TaxID=2972120 RepID=A0A9W9M4W4_9EURO|nr:hypothetical protein N7472_008339 [Penicillium cf. griseofulvum]KAJ5435059.1 hypothetical protein N7491_005654 [Penicillium cf. griseofulvum]